MDNVKEIEGKRKMLKDAIQEANNEADGVKSFEQVANEIDNAKIPSYGDFIAELPCGLLDEITGEIHKEFEVIESTGYVEEAIAGVARKTGGANVINKLLELCVVRVGKFIREEMKPKDWYREVVLKLSIPDQDFIAYKIRQISNDTEIESNHQCPACRAKLKYNFKVEDLPFKSYTGNEKQTVIFELPKGFKGKDGKLHKEVKMRMPNGYDREVVLPLARVNESKSMTLMLARICEFTDGYPLNDIELKLMKTMDRKYLEKQLRELVDFGIKAEVTIECHKCGNIFDSNLSALDNFF